MKPVALARWSSSARRAIGEIERHQRFEGSSRGQRRQDAAAVRRERRGVGHRRLQVGHHERASKALRGVRQHGGELRAVAQVQVPVVGSAQCQARHRGRSRRPRNAGSARSRDSVSHAESGELGGHVRETALAVARRQVQVHPGQRLRDEAIEKACRQDVIALALECALQHVGDRALEVAVEVLVHRKAPDPLAARAADALQIIVQLRAVRERAAVALGERVDAGARQRCEVEQQGRALARGERERVGQHHAALGVAVHDLDGDAVQRADHILRPVGARADLVLRDCEPAVDFDPHAAPRQREQGPDGDRAALHVAMHQVHAAVGLEINAARCRSRCPCRRGPSRRAMRPRGR